MKTFTIKEEHLKLIRHMNVDFDYCEFGAPEIDPKRPYGNSGEQVYRDIAEILDIELDNEEDIYDDQRDQMYKLHEETATALEIILRVGAFEAGDYEADNYRRNWRKV